MVSKYEEALNIWNHRLFCDDCYDLKVEDRPKECPRCVFHKIRPKKIDNLELSQINSNEQRKNDLAWKLERIGDLYKKMVLREYPLSEDDKKNLDEFVGLRINQVFEDIMVRFRWLTKESLEEAKNKAFEIEEKKKTI